MSDRNSRTLILLDVDGVLNPTVVKEPGYPVPRLRLSPGRTELVRRLAVLGTLVWASTHRAEQLSELTRELLLDPSPDQVSFTPAELLPRDADFPGTTPKLHSVARWVGRQDPLYSTIVWIDDVLRDDALQWANRVTAKVLLLRVNPIDGLQDTQVERVEHFLDGTH